MAKDLYTISVVIPAYNAERYIKRAIDSVFAQTYPAYEIVVVDDGSTDNTARILSEYGNKIIAVRQENAGANVARNTAIMQAMGNWIAFLDADDEWLPEKLEFQIALLKKKPDLVWLYGNYNVRRLDLNNDIIYHGHDFHNIELLLKNDCFFENFIDAYTNYIPVHTITMMIRKDILIEAGMFLPGQIINHDPDLALRISYKYPTVGYQKHPIAVHYFGRKNSITQQSKLLIQERCTFIRRHLELSEKYGVRNQFEPCALMLLRKWMREIQDASPGYDVSLFLKQFSYLIPMGLKTEIKLRMLFPNRAPGIINTYFSFKNFIKTHFKEKT